MFLKYVIINIIVFLKLICYNMIEKKYKLKGDLIMQKIIKKLVVSMLLASILILNQDAVYAVDTNNIKTEVNNITTMYQNMFAKNGITMKRISLSEVPSDVKVIKTNSVDEYKKVLASIRQETQCTFKDTFSQENISIDKVKKVRTSKKMYTASSLLTHFNLSAKISEYSNSTVKAYKSSCQMTMTGITYGKKLKNKEFSIRYYNNNKKVRVQCDYVIQYYISTPWGDIETISDGKNQFFYFTVKDGVHNGDVVG